MENNKISDKRTKKIQLTEYRKLLLLMRNNITNHEFKILMPIIKKGLRQKIYSLDQGKEGYFELNIDTLLILVNEIGLKNQSFIAALLYHPSLGGMISIAEIENVFDSDIANIVTGLLKVNELETNQSALKSENYTKLLLSFAQDMRVILIMIASRLHLMRNAREYDETFRTNLVVESIYIYAPLSHKLGLYKIKSEFEDLYLKYTNRETYDYISNKINESKESRDKYISEFVAPIKKRLDETGLNYEIKGRTKSIYSINSKLQKQKIDFESIYDLFAIRIVINTPLEKEKIECWQAYSIVTDLYQPNPKRLKDWLSIPKSNGYESLHITVMGQEARWVEVQIRTTRMDEIAERGLAAHWKYKGVKDHADIDDWLSNLRETLENKSTNDSEKLEDFKLDIYNDEIYVFTPKGDLHKLPKDSTVLDFAFSIHTKLGSTCISGKVNNRNVSIRHKLNNGDQIEIITSPNQTPKQDWLNVVTTSKAKNKIRQSLKEEVNKQVEYAKELLKRRFKNRKIEEDDALMMRLIKKKGFKTVTDFYNQIANEVLDVNLVIDQYLELTKKDEPADKYEPISATNYSVQNQDSEKGSSSDNGLIIDKNLTGIDYKLGKCCNPIYGDEIFGFVSSQGIKIHRTSCPNAQNMFQRYAYRILAARWEGKSDNNYTITLHIIGHDDIGIVTNITSIISREPGVNMRSINIDSNDGLFQGNISVTLSSSDMLKGLIKKLKTVKGVKQINRLS